MSILNKKKYVIAVSGGPDSMALLHMYRKYVKAVCTVKYNKRTDCQYDVDCVKKLTDKYNIPLEILDVTQQMYDDVNVNNFQNKARIIRYNFFKEIAKKYNTNKILVAHQIDDFLETAYMQKKQNLNLYFYGIKEKTILDNEFEIYRPLIKKYRKSTLQRYCDDYNIQYAIDSSNCQSLYERNKVRKIIGQWDTKRVYEFLKQIDKYNKAKLKEYKQNQKLYLKWKNSKFSVRCFKQFKDNDQDQIIYLYLQDHQFYRQSYNKIVGIKKFIIGMHGKEYRLNDNVRLKKNNKCITIVSKEK